MTHAITRPVTRSINRFVDAQRVIYPRIIREIRAGRKQTHWMWFVFPQLAALGKSETARYYGLADKAEALAFLDNDTLRMRLGECTMAVLAHPRQMFPHPDNHKLHASMTLFSQLVKDPTLPTAVLDKFYGGRPHQLTLDVLAGRPIPPQTAQGRVEIRSKSKWVQAALAMPERTAGAMSRREIQSFVAGLGLSSGLTRQIVDEWYADQQQAFEEGRDEGWEDAQSDMG